MSIRSVIVQAPASTSNCGPGFDTLSIALSLYNFIRLSERSDGQICPVENIQEGTQMMVEEASLSFAATAGLDVKGFNYEIWGEVPEARGLGSSSTIRAAIVAGLNKLHDEPLDQEGMIRLTTRLDNAPDNACAAFAGGFCIARTDPVTLATVNMCALLCPRRLLLSRSRLTIKYSLTIPVVSFQIRSRSLMWYVALIVWPFWSVL